jgi:hypothetical protein
MSDSRLLRIPQAAEYLNTAVRQIRSLIWRTEIPLVPRSVDLG